jgi:hypothetical protein
MNSKDLEKLRRDIFQFSFEILLAAYNILKVEARYSFNSHLRFYEKLKKPVIQTFESFNSHLRFYLRGVMERDKEADGLSILI